MADRIFRELEDVVANWDGRSKHDLEKTYNCCSSRPGFIAALIRMIGSARTQSGATWLVKRYLEQDGQLPESAVARIYAGLDKLSQWDAKLHVLQCMPSMPVASSQREAVARFLRDCLVCKRPFVRAWACNGFHELATQHREFRDEFEQLLEHASQDEAGSVRARVRNILNKDRV